MSTRLAARAKAETATRPVGRIHRSAPVHQLARSLDQVSGNTTQEFADHRFGHDFARMEVERPRGLEDEANRVAAAVLANADEPVFLPVHLTAPPALQKQERPETPPSITTLPGEQPADPKAEKEKKVVEMWKKLGAELAKDALKKFGKIPGVAQVYKAIEDLFDVTAVQITGGIGVGAATVIATVVNAISMESRTEPAEMPPSESMFGISGSWDIDSPPKNIKVKIPIIGDFIGDLPPSLSEEAPSSSGSTTLAGKPSTVPEDPIGKNLREAKEEEFVKNWVLSRQDEILNPLKENRPKPARRKKKKKKVKARKPAGTSERRRSREAEWPSFKRRSESAGLADNEAEVADAGRRTPGQRLEPEIRDRMERVFGCDFGSVRVHADAESVSAAEALNARAYTLGMDIVFGAGEYRPATARGLGLLAHELTHVLQQRRTQLVRNPPIALVGGGTPVFDGGNRQHLPLGARPSISFGAQWSGVTPPGPSSLHKNGNYADVRLDRFGHNFSRIRVGRDAPDGGGETAIAQFLHPVAIGSRFASRRRSAEQAHIAGPLIQSPSRYPGGISSSPVSGRAG